MTSPARHTAGVGHRPAGHYFFLSYAHSAPFEQADEWSDAEPDPSDADPVVGAFYADLARAVAARARTGDKRIGFFDQDIPAGSDIRGRLSEALGSAQVFIPLYSPGYLAKSWPQQEQDAFRSRLKLSNGAPERHIIPILWTPVLRPERFPEVERAMRVGGAGPEYVENGLRALYMLRPHRGAYESFRSWLAEEIVTVAERFPLDPPLTPVTLDKVRSSNVKEARFLVAMLGPGEVPARSRPWWGTEAAPVVVQHAASVADRLGLRSEVTDITEAEPLFGGTPAVVLVDPWLATTEGPGALAARFRNMPEWVVPVVLEEPRERTGPHFAAMQEAVTALRSAIRGRVESVSSMVQLDRILPGTVARARRSYLQQVQFAGLSAAKRPPRLRDSPEWPIEDNS